MYRSSVSGKPGRGRASVPYRALPSITFAFQPIVDCQTGAIVSYEALVRGARGESASRIIGNIAPEDLASFDELCRASAMALAAHLGMRCDLNLNLVPHGFQADRDCLASTLDAAIQHNFQPERLVVEVTERQIMGDQDRLLELLDVYRSLGMRLALDNFGATVAPLQLLVDFRPDQVKIDRKLTRSIFAAGPEQSVVRGIIEVCRGLGIGIVAEGVEDVREYGWLSRAGIRLFQGYLFGQPGFEALPTVGHLPPQAAADAGVAFP